MLIIEILSLILIVFGIIFKVGHYPGSSILFIVGIMLVTEGGHLAHIKIFGNEITPMSKTTFYFVIAVLIIVDIVQGKYQKKLLTEK